MTDVDIVAIAAHPDDAELGCGGALLIAADRGNRTAIVDLTAGESGTRGTTEDRRSEAKEAGRLLGLVERTCLGLPDGEIGTDHGGHRLAIVEALRLLRPRIVLAPWVQDRHPDHAAAGRLTREACFLARVRAVGDGPPHGVARLYHYMLHETFTPSFVVDVGDVWERKMAAVLAHQTQFGGRGEGPHTAISRPDFLRYIDARATTMGATIGAVKGEPFHHAGPMRCEALPEGPPTVDGVAPYSIYY